MHVSLASAQEFRSYMRVGSYICMPPAWTTSGRAIVDAYDPISSHGCKEISYGEGRGIDRLQMAIEAPATANPPDRWRTFQIEQTVD